MDYSFANHPKDKVYRWWIAHPPFFLCLCKFCTSTRIYKYPLPIETRLPVSPARPGAFNANFAPDTLDAFKNLCRQQGKAYTKVLEQFAEIYLKSNGQMLDEMPVPGAGSTDRSKDLATTSKVDLNAVDQRLSKLEEADEFNAETFETIFKRLLEVEKSTNCGQFRK